MKTSFFLFLLLFNTNGDYQITSYVNDYSKILNSGDAKELNNRLISIDSVSNTQIVFLIIPSLGGKNIYEYALQVANEYKIGKQYLNNGILFVISPEERNMRFMLGNGMEHLISDEKADSIFQLLVPFLKAKKYYECFNRFVDLVEETNGINWKTIISVNSKVELARLGNYPAKIVGKITEVTGNSFTFSSDNFEIELKIPFHYKHRDYLMLLYGKKENTTVYFIKNPFNKDEFCFVGI